MSRLITLTDEECNRTREWEMDLLVKITENDGIAPPYDEHEGFYDSDCGYIDWYAVDLHCDIKEICANATDPDKLKSVASEVIETYETLFKLTERISQITANIYESEYINNEIFDKLHETNCARRATKREIRGSLASKMKNLVEFTVLRLNAAVIETVIETSAEECDDYE